MADAAVTEPGIPDDPVAPIGTKQVAEYLARNIASTAFPVPMKDGQILMADGSMCSICLADDRRTKARYWFIPLRKTMAYGTPAIVCSAHRNIGREMVIEGQQPPFTVWEVKRNWVGALGAHPVADSRWV